MKKNALPENNTAIYIQSYKHDGSLHRTWAKGIVVHRDEDKIIAITNKANVIESDGRRWITREPAVYFLFTKEWFNVIAMIRKNGIYYYCNIASPSVYDEEALKNIDYDLDVKVYPDYSYQVLDRDEYQKNRKAMQYPMIIDEILEYALGKVIQMIENKEAPFNEDAVNLYYRRYLEYQSHHEPQKPL